MFFQSSNILQSEKNFQDLHFCKSGKENVSPFPHFILPFGAYKNQNTGYTMVSTDGERPFTQEEA